MARPLRVELPNMLYHVSSRGNAGGKIFKEEKNDHELFLKILGECCEHFKTSLHSYYLAPNQFQFLIETRSAHLSQLMKRLLGIYSLRFNRKYHRSGHLFHGRYKAIVIEKESYLLELSRYIHLAPCREGLARSPEEYPWSSMQYFLGRRNPPPFLEKEAILSRFETPEKYREFVLARHGAQEDILERAKGGVLLGSQEFVAGFREEISKKSLKNTSRTDEIFQVSFGILKEKLANEPPEIQIHGFWHWGKMRQEEIGEHFSKTPSAISHALKRFDKQLDQVPALRHRIKKLKQEILSSVTRSPSPIRPSS